MTASSRSHADRLVGLNPSGKRAIDEMREFAAELPDHIGPCFGRDVVAMLDAAEALLADLQRLEDKLGLVAEAWFSFDQQALDVLLHDHRKDDDA